MVQRMIALSMLLLLGPASVAATACAWVLWAKDQAITPEPHRITTVWEISGAYATSGLCDRARVKAWEHTVQYYLNLQRMGVYSRVEKGAPTEGLVYGDLSDREGTRLTRHLCLPDTIDPREKHASGH